MAEKPFSFLKERISFRRKRNPDTDTGNNKVASDLPTLRYSTKTEDSGAGWSSGFPTSAGRDIILEKAPEFESPSENVKAKSMANMDVEVAPPVREPAREISWSPGQSRPASTSQAKDFAWSPQSQQSPTKSEDEISWSPDQQPSSFKPRRTEEAQRLQGTKPADTEIPWSPVQRSRPPSNTPSIRDPAKDIQFRKKTSCNSATVFNPTGPDRQIPDSLPVEEIARDDALPDGPPAHEVSLPVPTYLSRRARTTGDMLPDAFPTENVSPPVPAAISRAKTTGTPKRDGPAAVGASLYLRGSLGTEVSELSLSTFVADRTSGEWKHGIFRPMKRTSQQRETDAKGSLGLIEETPRRRQSREVLLGQLLPYKDRQDAAKDDTASVSSGEQPISSTRIDDMALAISEEFMFENDGAPLPTIEIADPGDMPVDDSECSCQNSMFSGDPTQVEFYLPKLGMPCSCGKNPPLLQMGENKNPFDTENIFRPWQVSFLKYCGITHAFKLVETYEEDRDELVKKMKRYRKKKKLPAFRKIARGTALHIWCRTCIAVAEAVHKQLSDGATEPTTSQVLRVKPARPSVSTVGSASVVEAQRRVQNLNVSSPD